MGRASTAFPKHRLSAGGACAAFAFSALILAGPAMAQDRDAEPALEELIPDAAIDDPEAWAKDTTAAELARPGDPDPETPLADDPPGFRLAWPENDVLFEEIEPLETDPQLAEALSADRPVPAAALTLPEMGTSDVAGRSDLEEQRLTKRITLFYPERFAQAAPIDELEDRFLALSDIEILADDDDTLAQLGNRAREDKATLESLLRIYGFYDADVTQDVNTPPEGEGSGPDGMARARDARFTFTIDPGPRYVYSAIDLDLLGNTGDDFPALRDAHGLAVGDAINEDEIVTARGALADALAETGYAFADVGEPVLTIDHADDAGSLFQPVFPGGKYRFGGVISGNERFLSSKHLSDIARFDAGDVFQQSEVDDLRRAILATGLVSTLTLDTTEIAGPEAGEPGTVAVTVDMEPAPLRTIAGGLGYGTGEGFRAEVSWEHRNLLPPEGMVRARAIAGTQEQLLGLTFRRNNWHGRDKILRLNLLSSNVNRDAFEARNVSLSATFERLSTLLFQKEIGYSIGAEILASQEREGALDGSEGPRETYFVAALPGLISLDESDDLLDPTSGWRAILSLSPELSRNEDRNTEATYLRTEIEGRYYQPFSDNIVLAARAAAGVILGAGTSDIAPSRRFYAGGGGSVRGYGFQDIGPEDTLGEPTGGRSLAEFSLEARVRTGMFDGGLSVVPFLDAGEVGNDATPSFKDVRFGAGIGVRYHTSFGPLRVDVATPLNPRPGDSPIAVYVALGQAF